VTSEDFIKGQLCLIAWLDGFESGTNAMIGICHVVRNRVTAGWHDGDWVRTVWGLISARHRTWGEPPDVRDPLFMPLLQVVDSIYDGTRADKLTDGALGYFKNTEHFGALLESAQRVAQIGQLTFYK
jgi:hypothetical protein